MESRSSKVVQNFFDVLLEPPKTADLGAKPIAKLLESVGSQTEQLDVKTQLIDSVLLREKSTPEPVITTSDRASSNGELAQVNKEDRVKETINPSSIEKDGPLYENTLPAQLDAGFSVLFFDVMGTTLAIPLVKLKGIYRKKELTKIVGKPAWFSGVQLERDQQYNVIDTARYLMPEKYRKAVEYSPNYQYIIVIGDSDWALTCNRLIDSTTLSHDDIKWRQDVTRHPWFAGTVTQRMCGLLAVDALIELFTRNKT